MKKYPQARIRKFFCAACLGFLILAAALSGCTKKNSTQEPGVRTVNLAIWGNYLTPEEQARFERLTGIKVNLTNYSSNEELLAKLQAGAGGIDVAIPSDYMVGIMIKQGFLAPLKKELIPNWSEIDPEYLKQDFDPENNFSAPYAWSTSGIAIQKELFPIDVTSWKQILETPALKGRISLLDDTREVIALALLINGRSVNSTDSESLDKARATLKQIKPQVKMFRSDVVDTLIRKEVAIAHTYSLEALQAWKKTGGKVDYVIASEGGTKAIDSAVILKNAPHLKEAHELINFFLSPESNVQFVQHILAGPVLKKTREMLPAELKNHKGLFPPAEQMKKLESIRDVGESGRVFDRMWTEFKSM